MQNAQNHQEKCDEAFDLQRGVADAGFIIVSQLRGRRALGTAWDDRDPSIACLKDGRLCFYHPIFRCRG